MSRPRLREIEPPNPTGICGCGCGQATGLMRDTHTARGYIAGEHARFVKGHKTPKSAPNDDHPLAQDAWFAGFVDGEGCFFIQAASGERNLRVGFTIGLREDDAAILHRIAEAFGGRVTRARGAVGNSRPKLQVAIYSFVGIQALVRYFDRFPLRAKKERDFEVWRRAVEVARAAPSPERDRALACLRQELREARRYA